MPDKGEVIEDDYDIDAWHGLHLFCYFDPSKHNYKFYGGARNGKSLDCIHVSDYVRSDGEK